MAFFGVEFRRLALIATWFLSAYGVSFRCFRIFSVANFMDRSSVAAPHHADGR